MGDVGRGVQCTGWVQLRSSPGNCLANAAFAIAIFGAIAGISQNASAGNGIVGIAVGSQSLSLSGADQATQDDSFAVFGNPAALARTQSARFDVDQTISYAPRLRHSDSLNPGRETSRSWVPFAGLGFAKPAFDGRGAIGIGFAGIGGAGAFFEDLNTGLGTRDRLQGAFGIFRLAPAVAYEIAPKVHAGFSVGLTVARLDQQVFPDTSVANVFYGSKLTGATAVAPGYRIGATWEMSPRVTLGTVWSPKVRIDFKGGELISNQTSLGAGKVQYRNAESFGVNLPEEFGLAGTVRVTDDLRVMSRLAWLRWSRAIGQTMLVARDPSGSTSMPVLSGALAQNWRDQAVVAVGAEYGVSEKLKLRAGVNYGRNPIPKIVTSPLNNSVNEVHLSTGFGWAMKPGSTIDFVALYMPRADVRYNSPYSGIGGNARLQAEFFYLGFNSSLTW